MQLISAQNISYSINEKKLFHNLSFNVNTGEGLYIKGSNGSGKSTLLRIILRITLPSKGKIDFCNEDLRISYLGHKNATKSYLSPIQNLELIFSQSGRALAYEWLHKLGLKNVQDELTGNLSFGQQKKLALIRVLASSPNMIILDEPFVGLDYATNNLLNNFLAQKLREGISIIFTSHIQPSFECKTLEIER